MTQESVVRKAGPKEIAETLRSHDDILIVSHLRPDGDCLGSQTALYAGLKAIGKRVACFNDTGASDKMRFIPEIDSIRTEVPEWTPQVTVFVDCGGVDRVSRAFQPQGFTINIDHHATNDQFGDLNYIDISACAVGEQIYILLAELGVKITPEIATSIYTSVCADTGSFRFPNTNEATFELAAKLTTAGADPAEVCRHIFESRTRAEVLLTGKAYSRLQFGANGALSWSELLWEDYAAAGGEDAEPDGLATEIRAIDGVELSILFHELENGGIRMGFRGKGAVDCTKIAVAAGGGGHRNASGAYNDKVDYKTERDRILQLAEEEIARAMAEGNGS